MFHIKSSLVYAKEHKGRTCPVIQELRNYATNVYGRCVNCSDRTDDDLPAFHQFHHIIEMADGIHALLSVSCCEPAVPLLRSLFEGFLALAYMLAAENEVEYSRRLRSWRFIEVIKDIERIKILDPDYQRIERLLNLSKQAQKDTGISPDFKAGIKQKEDYLNSDIMADVAAEYNKLKAKPKPIRYPEWYNFFGGPRNLRELATKLAYEDHYEIVYPHWSRTSHSGDPQRYIMGQTSEKLIVKSLRSCVNIYVYAVRTSVFVLKSVDLMIHKFRPDEDYSGSDYRQWYAEMAERISMLSDQKIDIVPISMDQ
jgi:hypothetical protein